MSRYLSNFHNIIAPFQNSQQQILETIAELNGQRELVERYCCSPKYIAKRGYFCEDLFSLQALSIKERTAAFQKSALSLFGQFYENKELPDELIHVSCTGYHSPSAAQVYVSNRAERTKVVHAYHMGCLAALPAVRLGVALPAKRVDIVHTELCTLHFNPKLYSAEQLIAQSLFADGAICYTVSSTPGWRVIAQEEWIVPDTQEFMTWSVESWGFKMTLSKGIPVAIARQIRTFVEKLSESASSATPYYAIHPGGPKIIELVGEKLHLSQQQMSFSQKILYNHGNMSSATLPHIWQAIDAVAPSGSEMISLAFGPGLTLSGSLMRKET